MTPREPTITDFLSGGSLRRLCEAVADVAGRPVAVRDAEGELVAHAGMGDGAGGLATATEERAGIIAPIAISIGVIGELRVLGGEGADGESSPPVQRIAMLLAGAISDICEKQVELAHREEELAALRSLTSMLVGVGDTDALLFRALRSSMEIIGADAGTVRSLDDAQERLQLRAWTGLSDEYVARTATLPAESLIDRDTLTGDVVCVEDLAGDERALVRDAVEREGLRSMISVGLLFRGRPMGLLRLFTRSRRVFTDRERSMLQAIAQQASAALASARLLDMEKAHRKVRRQVKLAAQVQKRMLPSKIPQVSPFDIAARWIPSLELSGDFYDFVEINGRLGFVVGDVVGKGVAAALQMASLRSAIRAFAEEGRKLDEVMERVNRALCRDTLADEFATIFTGAVDPHTLRLTYCNAGHEPPLIVHAPREGDPSTWPVNYLTEGGMVVGVDPAQEYERVGVNLAAGDVLAIYTDGLMDTTNFDGEKFGKDRIRRALLAILQSEPEADAGRIADHLIWENRRFVGLNQRTDDTTVLVLRVRG